MPMLGSVRRQLLTPALAEVTFERRGFPGAASQAAATLEAVPQAVICGFEWGIEVRSQWELQRRLELLEPGLRGFGYEGATMACTVRDAMGPGGRRTRELLLGPGQRHIFLAYIGIGFAMARLPRVLWRKVLPDLPGTPYHPVMSWLAVDGYGFDRAYFETPRWVDEQWVGPSYPWLGCPEYFPRAVDQGVGRALWFIHGAEPAGVAAAVDRFAEHRRADLWAGVGLAATFAGGCPAEGLAALRASAGKYRRELGQGAVFAAKARHYSGTVPPESELGVGVLAGLTVPAACGLADDTAVTEPEGGPTPNYETWRRRVRDRIAED
jgi:hypothetical protein